MSLSIPGYKVSEKVNEGSKSVVYRAIRSNTTELSVFLHNAAQITTTLEDIRKEDIIHQDVNPSNIIINSDSF